MASERTEREKLNMNDGPAGFTGSADTESGEYRYKSGYTQRIYSDAHYVPADENTVPPRYYTPPEEPIKDNSGRAAGKRSHSKGFVLLCVCLACFVTGGAAGALVMGNRIETRLEDVELRLTEAESGIEEANALGEKAVTAASAAGASTSAPAGSVAPSEIYAMACKQVVGISTDVTYTNFFGQNSSAAVSGSGFIIAEDGYILTNYHVIEYAFEHEYDVTVMLHDGTVYTASIVGVEESNDIAVLKIDASGLTPVTFGDSSALSVGDEVYAVGNPLGELEFSMTFGRVSALDRLITTEENELGINMFQFDAAVNSGNSGGPVYNAKGEVVGIVTAKYSSTGVEGLGFAVPMSDAADIASDLITKGYVTGKAYMGVQLDQRFTAVFSRYYGLPMGAYVSYVERGSCAEQAGIQSGDIITAIGEIQVKSYSDVNNALRRFSAGENTTISVYRSGNEMQLEIVFDEVKPDGDSAAPAQGSAKR